MAKRSAAMLSGGMPTAVRVGMFANGMLAASADLRTIVANMAALRLAMAPSRCTQERSCTLINTLTHSAQVLSYPWNVSHLRAVQAA